ncbi:MAG: exodeoxyribonuclease VII small subunit [Euryarchaeota archaeon RBG_16_68_12]|nr:MAG: exodeoxyribonuclease VII small subunit [Euryarchaeota archaeon RBG_16_68_12]
MTEKTFEEALEELESKVEALSAGHLSLADGLRTYEEGVALVRVCDERLAEAELTVTRLSGE